jgi:hypothetical protein
MKKTLTSLALAALTLTAFGSSVFAAFKPAAPPHPDPRHKPHKHAIHKPVAPAHKHAAHKHAPPVKTIHKHDLPRPVVHKPVHKKAFKPVTVSKAVAARYAYTRGVKFTKGYYYTGRAHYHWSKRYWSPRWRSWFFFDPSVRTWYYWSGAQVRYYPINYITTVPPTGYVLPAPVVATQKVTTVAARPKIKGVAPVAADEALTDEVGECQASLAAIAAAVGADEPQLPEPPQ